MSLMPSGDRSLPEPLSRAAVGGLPAVDRAPPVPRAWTTDDGSDAAATVTTLLAALRRWWMVCLPLGLLAGTVAAAAVWYLFVPQYEAIAWLRVAAKAPYVAFPQESRAQTNPLVQTQIELIRSPLVLERVVERDDVKQLPSIRKQHAPEEWLGLKLGIEPVAESEFFTLRFACPDPQEAMLICNAVLDTYLVIQSEFADAHTLRIIELLKAEGAQRQSELEKLRNRVRDIAKDVGGELILDGDQQGFQVTRPAIAELQRRLTDAEFEQEVLRARIRAQQELGNSAKAPADEATVAAALAQDPQYKAIENLLVTKRSQLYEVEAVSLQPDRDPVVGQLRREIAKHESKLEALRTELAPKIAAQLEARRQEEQKQKLAELQSQLDAYAALEVSLRQQLEKQRGGGGGENGEEAGEPMDLEFAKYDLARAEEVFQRIATRTDALASELKAPAAVSEVRRAKVPRKPLEEVPTLKMAAAGVGGFLLPFVLLLGWERMVRRVANSKQLAGDAHVNILGEIAVLPERPFAAQQPRSRAYDQQITRFQESIEYLRINLAVREGFDRLQTLLVASAVSREGKTRLACNLAICFARAYREKTLLIDADLRSPDIHRLFEVNNEPGLAEVLEEATDWRDTIVTTWGQHLHFIPAGRLTQSPHILLSGGRLEALLDEIKQQYRFIVIDGPPVLPVGDTLLLSRAVDGVLLSAMHNVSREPEVRSTVERLRGAGANVLGAVLCAVPQPGYGYGYRDYVYSRPQA